MEISLRQLEVFVSTVENRSFSKAAEALFLSQSTVSSHIAQLEAVLQQPLLERRDKRLAEPTAVGRRVYNAAKEILALCRNMQEEFSTDESGPAFISIAASTVPSRYLVPQLIAAYVAKYPGTRFSVLEGDSTFALEKLKSGEAAVAFLGTRYESRSFQYHAICKDRLVLITPNTEEFLSKQKDGVLGKELLSYPMIMREPGSGTRNEMHKYLTHIGVNPASLPVVAYMSDMEAIKKAVINGLGISIISERVAERAILSGEVLCFQLDAKDLYRNLYLAHAKNRHLRAAERNFIAFATKN
ncbi:MAG TPA: selenium metabolism-associated LysR family transcriptional regulator [Clostridia bacterium]|nr:selenium metabolism-associated LysR family transcriptional regulator [Clostridia bacterium]